MRPHLARLIALALFVSPAAAQDMPDEQGTPDTPRVFEERLEVDIVNLAVHVTDRKGNPIQNLQRGDFELFVDGEPVEIANFYAVEDGRRTRATAPGDAFEPLESTAAAEPLFLVVFFDNVYLGQFSRNRLIEELRGFLSDRLRQGEQVMLVSFDGSLRLHQTFTGDPALLGAALDAIAAEPTYGHLWDRQERQVLDEMMALSDLNTEVQSPNVPKTRCPRELGNMARRYANEVHAKVTGSVDNLSRLIGTLASLPGRKAVLHVSDGIPFQPGIELFEFLRQFCGESETRALDRQELPPPTNAAGQEAERELGGLGVYNPVLSEDRYDGRVAALQTSSVETDQLFAELTRHANAHRVTFFPVETYGIRRYSAGESRHRDSRTLNRSADQVRWTSLQSSLKTMADDTGGRAILDTTDFAPALDRVGADLGNYYSLGFDLPDSEEVSIGVRVRHPKARVRHRKLVRSQSLADELAGRTQAALMYGMVDNPLAVELAIGEARRMDADLHVVPIRLSIPLGNLVLVPERGAYQGRLQLFVSGQDRHGRFAPVRTSEIPISIPSDEIEIARQKHYLYEVKMLMKEGDHTVAVGLHDANGAVTSYLKEDVVVR